MRVTIFTAGSTGDVLPCLLLGRKLQDAGYQALLAAPENFGELVRSNGLAFHPLRGDVQAIMAGETGRKFMETAGANPVRAMLAMRKMIAPVALQMAEDALEASRGADALISLAVFAPFGKTIAELCRIPMMAVEPTPMLPSRAFPAAGWPVQRSLGGPLNRFSGHAMLWMIWQWYAASVNELRRRYGLRSLGSASFYRALNDNPLLGAYSPSLIPHPADWPDTVHITGYWFQDAGANWRPPSDLRAFLEAGEPPVYVGFGSMAGRSPEHFASLVLEALAKSGRRGLLLTGWGGLNTTKAPENVFVLDAAPHSWLFPRMAAVVHHGGAGTTAEGLRAGRPTVIVPFIVDQPFWGERVKALGVGPQPLPAKTLSADRLAEAIYTAATDPIMQERAAALGGAICAEGGLGSAVKIIRQYLGE